MNDLPPIKPSHPVVMEDDDDLESHGNCYVRPSDPRPLVNRMTAREMDSLTAICDTLLPSIDKVICDDQAIRRFYLTSASMFGTPEIVGAYMSTGRLRHPMVWMMRVSLWFLSTWYGTVVLCGRKSLSRRFPFFHRLSEVDPRRREEILLGWSLSSIYLYRQFFRALKYLIVLVYFTQVNDKNENPTWQALRYCGADPQHAHLLRSAAGQIEQERLGPLHRSLVYMDSPRDALSASLSRAGLTITARPHPQRRSKPMLTIRCDAVVVGSGSGGGVVAGVLAQAGYKVVVLEKGGYHARSNLSLLEGHAMEHMYEGCGLLATQDTGVVILAGSTVGGGSTINWSASFRTPSHVIREWRHEHGLELFGSDAYEEALEAVCARMGVQPDVDPAKENLSNAALRRGCMELGYPVCDVPRNSPADHDCGWCCFGCRDGRKKGTSETWLVDMAESGNGVVLPGCNAVRVVRRTSTGKARGSVAVGVEFEYDKGGKKEVFLVESRVTVVACGALGTPVLLRRSGLRNPNIGRNLHLHPVVMVWGYFPATSSSSSSSSTTDHSSTVSDAMKGKTSYEGGILTAMSTVAGRKSGYGAVIQTPALHPGMFSVLTPWASGEEFKGRMSRFARTAHMFALARDRGSGTVEDGTIRYRMEASDEEVLKEGVEKALRIMVAAGAAEVGTQRTNGGRVATWTTGREVLEQVVREEASKVGMRDLSTPVCSAHQMGSCRMGRDPRTSAVDPRGEAWEVEGLYVADSSVLPTALGVNPMVTVQAIAYCTAHSVLQELKRRIKRNKNTTCVHQ